MPLPWYVFLSIHRCLCAHGWNQEAPPSPSQTLAQALSSAIPLCLPRKMKEIKPYVLASTSTEAEDLRRASPLSSRGGQEVKNQHPHEAARHAPSAAPGRGNPPAGTRCARPFAGGSAGSYRHRGPVVAGAGVVGLTVARAGHGRTRGGRGGSSNHSKEKRCREASSAEPHGPSAELACTVRA